MDRTGRSAGFSRSTPRPSLPGGIRRSVAAVCAFTVAVLALLWVFPLGAAAQTIVFTANLDGAQAGTSSTATGTGILNFDPSTNLFDLDLVVTGIGLDDLSPAGPNSTPIHVHQAPPGERGGIIVDIGYLASFTERGQDIVLSIDDALFGGTQGNLFSEPADNAAALLAGNTYLNLHTTAFPGGEIRGQLVPIPATLPLLGSGLVGLAAIVRRRRNR